MRATIFLPLTLFRQLSIAAIGTAPAPSEMTLARSSRRSIALALSSSPTVTMSSTYFFIISNVSSPGVFTAIPSAIVGMPATVVI